MVVDANVNPSIVETAVAAAFADNEERGGLLPTFVAPGALACTECGKESDRKVALGYLERTRDRFDDGLAGEDVALAREILAHEMAGPGETFLPRV